MKRVLSKIWAETWAKAVAGVLTAAIVGTAGYFVSWADVTATCRWAWHVFVSTTLVPNWLLGVLVLSTVALILAIAAAIFASRGPTTPPWESYREDVFFKIKWRWRYGTTSILRLESYCPHCDYQVFPSHSSGYHIVDRYVYQCDDCGSRLHEIESTVSEFESRVERLILRNLREKYGQSPRQEPA